MKKKIVFKIIKNNDNNKNKLLKQKLHQLFSLKTEPTPLCSRVCVCVRGCLVVFFRIQFKYFFFL